MTVDPSFGVGYPTREKNSQDVYERRLECKKQQKFDPSDPTNGTVAPNQDIYMYIDLYKSGIITLQEARIFLGIEK